MSKSLWTRTKESVANVFKAPRSYNSVQDSRQYSWLHDFGGTGYWQQDITIDRDTVLSNWAVFSCISLIASDIGKVSLKLMEDRDGICYPIESAAFSPVIRKPNSYQTRQQFIEAWVTSKLGHGNAYILKERDMRGVVIAEHVLDPTRVYPLVANDGSVFYQLMQDDLARVGVELVAVPASEIIHDRMNCFFHPLVGLSPIYASGLSAMQGIHIQKNSTKFFENMSRPSGILTAPGSISNETAERLKAAWESNYSGSKIGKTAVLGDDLKYQSMAVTAADAQMIEQLKFSAEMICSTFHVPAFKIGAGTIPAGQKVEDLNQIYYSDCLHALMDAIQTLQTHGLITEDANAKNNLSIQFDLNDLLKMDSKTLSEVESLKVGGGISSPDEARRKFNLPPVQGGEIPYLQQQNYSLAALSYRDRKSLEETTDVQASAMNGAQVTALQGIMIAAAAGNLPKETARAAIAAAFPLLSQDQIDAMVNPIPDVAFVQPAPEPTASAQVQQPQDPEDDADEMDAEEMRACLDRIVKGLTEYASA